MARPLRIEYAGAFYHVMNRGAEHKPIFFDSLEDRALFLKTLGEAAHLWKIRVHAYALMENHYHLLIETPLPNLSRALRHLDGIFTQRLNRKVGRDGSLFRGRFKSILVEKDSYFLELVRYIHLNAVKALKYPHPSADPHCSHGCYLGIKKCPPWLVTEMALSFFGSDKTERAKRFDDYVREGIPNELETTLARKRWPAILGVKSFIDDIRHRFRLGVPPHQEKPQERDLMLEKRRPPEQALKRVAEIFGIEEDDLICRGGKKHSDAKQTAIYVLRYACHLSYSQIGKCLGGMGDSAVLYGLNRLTMRPTSSELQKVKDEFGLDEAD